MSSYRKYNRYNIIDNDIKFVTLCWEWSLAHSVGVAHVQSISVGDFRDERRSSLEILANVLFFLILSILHDGMFASGYLLKLFKQLGLIATNF